MAITITLSDEDAEFWITTFDYPTAHARFRRLVGALTEARAHDNLRRALDNRSVAGTSTPVRAASAGPRDLAYHRPGCPALYVAAHPFGTANPYACECSKRVVL